MAGNEAEYWKRFEGCVIESKYDLFDLNRRIFLQIAQGLHYLHDNPKHYVHRDIKPGNVLRVGDAWKLADFGIMQQLRGLTTVMTIQNPGTFPFMSPEANDGKISPAWDVWSLGVLMVHCLTGEYPFRQTQEKTLVQSIREDEPHFATPIRPDFENVIRGCLTKDYRNRWMALQVVEALATPVKLNGAELIYIPAGEFTMGSNYHDTEKPAHKVYLDNYYIARTPVTVRQYKQFCTQMRREMPPPPSFNPNWSKEDHPIVNISWFDATAYCEWLSQESGSRVSLPTEAQWEKAASGTEWRKYPWGNDWDSSKLQCSKHAFEDAGSTAAVGDYPVGASPYGVLDMSGNVCQWCSDWYDANYYQNSAERNPAGPSSSPQGYRVLRGGSWGIIDSIDFRCAVRYRGSPMDRLNYIGFRYVVAISRP